VLGFFPESGEQKAEIIAVRLPENPAPAATPFNL
jgi:hypothetical protein